MAESGTTLEMEIAVDVNARCEARCLASLPNVFTLY
jgi:hypothetical protein